MTRTAARVIACVAAGVALLIALATMGSIVMTSSAASLLCTADQLGGTVGAGDWITVGATLDPSTAPQQAYPSDFNGGLSYAELGATPGYPNYVGGLIARALGLQASTYGLPAGFALDVRAVGSQGSGVRVLKSDIGSGQAGDLSYVIDLHPAIATAIGFGGKGPVQIRVDGTSGGALPTSLDVTSCVTAVQGPAGAEKILQLAQAVLGTPYSMGGHATAFTMSAAQLRASATDCSGFVSWLMGPQGLNVWSQPYATPAIPSAPGLAAGPGQYITLLNNPGSGQSGHVVIEIMGQWFQEGGSGQDINRVPAGELQYYRSSGLYVAWHPAGY